MSYKVTVIIPTYNSAEFLDSTIESVQNQSIGFENIELIIVDDYSTDNTQELINSYCEKYENVKTFPSGLKTGTPGRARNIAIANSTGEYIMFLDHDDKYLPDTVETLYDAAIKNKSDVTVGKFQNFGENDMTSEGWVVEDVTLNSIDDNLLFFSINNIWRMIFPKEFLIKNEINFPEGVFAEDLAFMIDSFINTNKIVFINKVVYNFRLRTGAGSSTSLSKGMHYLNGLIKGYKNVYDVLEKNDSLRYYDTIFNQHLSCWLSDVCLSETISTEDKKELVNQSAPFFDKLENNEPFPQNDSIKEIINEIRDRNFNKAYKLMNRYKKSMEPKVSAKRKVKNLVKRFF